MKISNLSLIAAIAMLGGAELRGQQTAKVPTAATNPVATTPVPETIEGTLTMMVNRARVLGDKVDGAGTRYFSVNDSYLAGKTPAEVIQRLTPPAVTPQQHVRTLDIVVALDRPLFVTTTGKAPFAIGTALLDGKVNDLQVNSNINLEELTITRKD
jgi:hypothetical protein